MDMNMFLNDQALIVSAATLLISAFAAAHLLTHIFKKERPQKPNSKNETAPSPLRQNLKEPGLPPAPERASVQKTETPQPVQETPFSHDLSVFLAILEEKLSKIVPPPPAPQTLPVPGVGETEEGSNIDMTEWSSISEAFSRIILHAARIEAVQEQSFKDVSSMLEKEIQQIQTAVQSLSTNSGNAAESRQAEIIEWHRKLSALQQQLAEEEKGASLSLETFRQKIRQEEKRLANDIETRKLSSSNSLVPVKQRILLLEQQLATRVKAMEENIRPHIHAVSDQNLFLQKRKEAFQTDYENAQQKNLQELRLLDLEIAQAKKQISEAELNWKNRISQNEKTRRAESAQWIEKYNALQKQREQFEKDAAEEMSLLREQEKRIETQSDETIRALNLQYEKKQKEIEETSARLNAEIEALKKTTEQEMNEFSLKEKGCTETLLQLQSEMKRLENENSLKENNLNSSHILWKENQENQISQLQLAMEELKKHYSGQNRQREDEIRRMREKFKEAEESLKNNLRILEKKGFEEKSRLNAEKLLLDKELDTLRATARQHVSGLENEIEKTKVSLAQNENENRQHVELEKKMLEKIKKPLLEALENLKEKIAREKTHSAKALQEKDEEIKTLTIRLSWREERIASELSRRQEALEKMIQKYAETLKKPQEQKHVERSHYESEVHRTSLILKQLEEMKQLQLGRAKEMEMKKEILHARDARMKQDVSMLEEQWTRHISEFSGILAEKEREIASLQAEIIKKEKEMESAGHETGKVLQQARQFVFSQTTNKKKRE